MVYFYHIETAGYVLQIIFLEIAGGGVYYPLLLAQADSFCRPAILEGRTSLDLTKHQTIIFLGDDVYLAAQLAILTFQYLIAVLL